MASSIDATKPVAGTPTTASVRSNFAYAKSEIEALQTADATKAASGANSDITSITGLTTPLSAPQGGTGTSTYAIGDSLYANTVTSLAKLVATTAGLPLVARGASTNAAYGIALALGGGTGISTYAVGDQLYAATATTLGTLTATTAGLPLVARGASTNASYGIALALGGGTGFSTYAVGDLLYADTATTLAKLAATTAGYIVKLQGGVPIYSSNNAAGDMLSTNNLSDVASIFAAQATLSVLALGVHQIGSVPARAMVLPTTSAAGSLARSESATNKVNVEYIPFSDAATTYAEFSFRAPKSSDETGAFSAEMEWTEATSASAHVCRWQIAMQAQGDADTIDSAWGTVVEGDDTGSDGTRRFVTLSSVSVGGTWAENDMIHARVGRSGTHSNDTLDVIARLIRATLSCTIAAKNDA